MRKFLLSTAALAIGATAIAQPILNTGFGPSPGTVFSPQRTLDTAVALSTGPRQNWSIILTPAPGTVYPITVHEGAGTPRLPYFYQSNFYHSQPGPSFTTLSYLLNDTARGLFTLGEDYQNGLDICARPVPRLPYYVPFGQSKTFISLSYDSSSPQSQIHFLKDYDTLTYAGYGTLTLNGAVYQNCVLIEQRVVTYINRHGRDTSQGFTLFNRIWGSLIYAPGIGYPIVAKGYSMLGGNTPSVSYLSDVIIANRELLSYDASWIWPNPARSFVKIGLDLHQPLYILNAVDGTHTTLPYANNQADLSSLPPGLYILETEHQGRRYRARVVKQ